MTQCAPSQVNSHEVLQKQDKRFKNKDRFVNKKIKPFKNSKAISNKRMSGPNFPRVKYETMSNGYYANINLRSKNNYESPEVS